MKLHRVYTLSAFVLLSVLSSYSSFAQDPPMTWGEIPKADLEMKSFPQDTNASALILCDYGESFFNNHLDIVFKKHLRVKILTTKGYEWGTHSIVLYTEERTESIGEIEGVTYSLDNRGETVKKELDKDEIFKEKADDKHTLYKFTLPGLTPGCVIEIRYTIESQSLWRIRDWVFQHSEPVRWSEYRIRTPKSIAYSAVSLGYEPFAIHETQDVNQLFSGVRNYLGDDYVACTQYRWAVRNLPALRDEPFITTIGDYVNKVDVQLAGYAFPSTGVKHIMTTWNLLVNELVEYKDFLERVDDTRRVRKQAEQITAGLPLPEDKVRAIYNWVSKSIVWNGLNQKYSDIDVNDVLESKKGSSAEITFLVLSLLKSIGINGEPVILSTRDNGKIQDVYPIESQFNYVLARATIGSEHYYLDATDPLRPMELLPTKALNVLGLVIKKDSVEWVPLTTQKRYLNASLAIIKLQANGSLSGILEDVYREYASLFTRRGLKDKKDLDIAKEKFETEEAGITIDSVSVEGRDSLSLPLKLKAWISSQSYAQSNGDLIYINPHILHRSKENPFKTKVRKFPVDYSYQRSYTSVTTLTLPDSFTVKALPPERSLYVGSNLLSYSQRIQADSHQIQIMNKLEIRETEIKPKFYAELRDFYSHMVAIESEQLVLERIKKPATPIQSIKPETKIPKKKGKK